MTLNNAIGGLIPMEKRRRSSRNMTKQRIEIQANEKAPLNLGAAFEVNATPTMVDSSAKAFMEEAKTPPLRARIATKAVMEVRTARKVEKTK
jgi:hypothetical protein